MRPSFLGIRSGARGATGGPVGLVEGNRPGVGWRSGTRPGAEARPSGVLAAHGLSTRKPPARAGVPLWHPHRLRHNAATFLRKEFGLDVARVILGHSSPAVTESYAEVDRAKAIAAMARVG